MKLETYLNAMTYAFLRGTTPDNYLEAEKYYRQHYAFRGRILRMDAEKDAEITKLRDDNGVLIRRIYELENKNKPSVLGRWTP